MTSRIVYAAISLFTSTTIFAIDPPTYGGDGCPASTAEISLDNEGYTFNLRDYRIDLNSGSVIRKSCNIAIPYDVPPGYQVQNGTITIQGNQQVPEGFESILDAETFIAGTRGPVLHQATKGPRSEPFVYEIKPPMTWSACGSDVILRVNTALALRKIKSNAQGPTGAYIESIRLDKPMLRRCN